MFIDQDHIDLRTPSGVLCFACSINLVGLLNDIALLTECPNPIRLRSINIALLTECGLARLLHRLEDKESLID